MSLYTKYRPESFDQMQGQEHIRTTLQNAITQDKIAHAYIFTGPRGTGKTTTARILAKHIVQEDKDPNNTQDIIEMDAASNTSVDDIRHIIENSVIAPVFADKKVYIIDEIHMLSKSAFNALLKTLEEPPKHVYFILATTDIDKVPATVISRCQRFDFRSLNQEELLNKIKNICETEQKEYELSALELLANAAE
ncbi:MAG: DNA polymerase III subunit gamma/tau [Patescibacteria group bacterium]|nr:DNA polymerase III subunit gamma/tau [Patescibacteria group bacterium]